MPPPFMSNKSQGETCNRTVTAGATEEIGFLHVRVSSPMAKTTSYLQHLNMYHVLAVAFASD